MFDDSNAGFQSVVVGTNSGGKSILTIQARENARQRGSLLVDTELFREGRGLKPYEYEYTRRLLKGLYGALPRELRGKAVTLISDVSRPKNKASTKARCHNAEWNNA